MHLVHVHIYIYIHINYRYMDYVSIYTVYLGEVGNRGPRSFVHIYIYIYVYIYNLCNMGFEDIRLKCDIDEVKMMAPFSISFARH